MRYFKQYLFKVGRKIEFKDLFGIVDTFISEQGLRYDSMGYDLISLDGHGDKLLRKIPQLGPGEIIKDRYNDMLRISNMVTPRHFCDEASIRLIGSKIPRPYNFFDTHFYYRNITFFGKQPSNEQIRLSENQVYLDVIGSYIELYRDFEGPQTTAVRMKIEVLDHQTCMRADEYAQTLSEALGKVKFYAYASYGMDASEEALYAQLQKEAAGIVDSARMDLSEKSVELTQQMQRKFPVCDERKFSIAKPMKRIGNVHGYSSYAYVPMGVYRMSKRVKGGNHIILEIDMGPMFRQVGAGFYLSGAGFSYMFPCAFYGPSSQEDMDFMITRIFETIAYFEERYMPEIVKLYPETPEWFPVCLEDV